MKYAREIKVGILATICIFLLFFGFNFLKGVNIFSPTNSFHGTFAHLHGLEEQAAVYIRGHKVGQVDAIHYDYTRDSAFTVDISIKKDISLPQGTTMALYADGILGGKAIELILPLSQNGVDAEGNTVSSEELREPIAKGAFLPTTYIPGLMESLQGELMAHVDEAIRDVDRTVNNVDSLVTGLRGQVEGNHLKHTLANVDRVSGDLTSVSGDLKAMMNNQLPRIVNNADTGIANLNTIVADVKEADLKATVARVDTAVDNINAVAHWSSPWWSSLHHSYLFLVARHTVLLLAHGILKCHTRHFS
jgi:phospholipid/cholesterol/gamma-HCH transport system substrate-binding protein